MYIKYQNWSIEKFYLSSGIAETGRAEPPLRKFHLFVDIQNLCTFAFVLQKRFLDKKY